MQNDWQGPALAVLECESIARGIVVVDAMVKRAEARVVRSEAITPGKYLIVLAGSEAEVEESLAAGREVSGPLELDVLYLPHVHDDVFAALIGKKTAFDVRDSLGVLEMRTVAATILAADRALKAANVRLVQMELARGIGGKGYFVFEGELDAVEAALEAGDEAVAPAQRIGRELIARPHSDLTLRLK